MVVLGGWVFLMSEVPLYVPYSLDRARSRGRGPYGSRVINKENKVESRV